MGQNLIEKIAQKYTVGETGKAVSSGDYITIRPEHIMISILNDDDNRCVDILRDLGVDLLNLYDRLSEHLKDNDMVPRITTTKRKLPPSEITAEIFNAVDGECDKLGDNVIDSRHVMLAILNHDTPTTNILHNMGVNYKNYKNAIMNENEEIKELFEDPKAYNGDRSSADMKLCNTLFSLNN